MICDFQLKYWIKVKLECMLLIFDNVRRMTAKEGCLQMWVTIVSLFWIVKISLLFDKYINLCWLRLRVKWQSLKRRIQPLTIIAQNSISDVNYYRTKLHIRCLTEFYIRLCLSWRFWHCESRNRYLLC